MIDSDFKACLKLRRIGTIRKKDRARARARARARRELSKQHLRGLKDQLWF